ncbi:helix-turn-helix domain-containing protein [Bacillus sp. AFS041924]|uniref:helix-turn-helix domain-containing protein n=1 Tax=Bacillus sp. AFS041924 TaxID=2033503 RepID=UPI000BFDBB5A|nr:helix-turn-helix domain-containing protein [Bacillus sp. AFS041924]PGS54227.1 hypothetical protein COC46_05840 [Bacillus sp. AFS041924]
MKLLVTIREKEEVQKHTEDFIKLFEQSEINVAFIKLLVNHLNPNVPNLEQIARLLQNNSSVSAVLSRLIDSLVESEDENISDGFEYSTSDLSKYFQVSQTTINKWINKGRFIGVNRERNKHKKINENVEWKSFDGSRIKIKEIVENYQINNTKPPKISKEEEREEILLEINALREKYRGDLDQILASKDN